MGKLDEIKGEIDWLGRWLNVLVVADFALIGWLALNYEIQKSALVYSAVIAVFGISIGVLIINRSAMKKIREMRDVKK